MVWSKKFQKKIINLYLNLPKELKRDGMKIIDNEWNLMDCWWTKPKKKNIPYFYGYNYQCIGKQGGLN